MNGDSLPDLFFTIAFEEFVLGGVLLGSRGAAPREVYKSGPDACSVPKLEDVNRDGLQDILEKEAGAVRPDECTGDPYATVCMEAYPTEWIQVLLQQPDGHFKGDSLKAREFYADLAKQYSNAARELRAALAKRSGPAARSPRCNEAMARDLDSMAARAVRIAES